MGVESTKTGWGNGQNNTQQNSRQYNSLLPGAIVNFNLYGSMVSDNENKGG